MTDYSKEDIDKDLKLLKNQVEISKNEVIKLLKKHNGDISKCVLDFYEYVDKEETNPYEDRGEDDPHKKLYELRKILDEKDAFFTKMMENKNSNNHNTDH